MSFLDSQAGSSRPLCLLLSGVVLAGSLALGACDGTDDQLAPSTEDPMAPGSDAAASDWVSVGGGFSARWQRSSPAR